MPISDEEARKIMEARDSQFNTVKEVGEVQSLPNSNVPPPKPKEKKEEPIQAPVSAQIIQNEFNSENVAVKNIHQNFDIGWYEVPMESLPTQGLFYPEGSRLLIKPAGVSIIRHFSTVDDTNPLELNDAFDYILENLVRFNIPDMSPSFKNLKDIDKLSVILHVRDATFKNGESNT